LRQTEALEEEEEKREREAPRRGVRSEVWRVKPKVDGVQQSESSATSVNVTFILLLIQAVGSPNLS
jgi:hypothetical protein